MDFHYGKDHNMYDKMDLDNMYSKREIDNMYSRCEVDNMYNRRDLGNMYNRPDLDNIPEREIETSRKDDFDSIKETVKYGDNTSAKQGFSDGKMYEMPMTMPPKRVPNLIDSFTENIKHNFLTVNKVNRYLCQCFDRHTYIWLDDNKSFWIWLIAIYKSYIICYRWNGSRWVSAQIAKNKIKQIG